MSITRRIREITVEIERLTASVKLPQTNTTHCLRCEEATRLIDFSRATEISRLSRREVSILIEKGDIHIIVDQNGVAMVCFNSVVKNNWFLKNSGNYPASGLLPGIPKPDPAKEF